MFVQCPYEPRTEAGRISVQGRGERKANRNRLCDERPTDW